MPEIAFFLLAVSLISSFPISIFYLIYVFPLIFVFPLYWIGYFLYVQGTMLSYPLYVAGESLFSSRAVPVRFFTIEIFSRPNGFDVSFFSFFLLVNTLGALLGYLIGRRYKFSFGDGWRIPCGLAGIACIAISFVLASTPALYATAGIVLLGIGVSLLDTALLSWLIEEDFLSVFKHARIATFLVLGGTILFLTGHQISQLPIILGGQTLVLLGVAVYVVKLVFASARIHLRSRNADLQPSAPVSDR